MSDNEAALKPQQICHQHEINKNIYIFFNLKPLVYEVYKQNIDISS